MLQANKTKLCRDMWPSGVGVLVQERSLDVSTMSAAKLVPDDREDLTEWLWVDLQPELGQALVYIRSDVVEGEGAQLDGEQVPATKETSAADPDKGVGGDGEPLKLVLRLQGLIAEMNLNVGGDWDG